MTENKPVKKKATPKKVKLVKMERDGQTANVHPDEVENYSKAGYR